MESIKNRLKDLYQSRTIIEKQLITASRYEENKIVI